ncbi:hypothetical protein, partial [Galactobacter sp.]|uniref:hypothetical protein n=1 Tax=Galactobacter sp. TaxID=2676125 RepID=UPI0025C3F5ED
LHRGNPAQQQGQGAKHGSTVKTWLRHGIGADTLAATSRSLTGVPRHITDANGPGDRQCAPTE